MSQHSKIFSLSKQLKSLNTNLSEYITVISEAEMPASIAENPSSTLIFEERHIPQVLNIAKAKYQCRLICISQNLDADDRLVLLNRDIECISSEKYTQVGTYFFDMTITKKNYKVLIVEDDENQILLTEHVLQNADIAVHSITKGAETLEAIANFKPDLILMDLYLDDINGDEIVKQIRKNKDHAWLPIVFLTSDTSIETRMNVLNAGADDLLTKPINAELLVAALKNRMQRSTEYNIKPMVDIEFQEDIQNSITHKIETIEAEKDDDLSEKLTNLLNDNRKNDSASILWLKTGNKQFLQKKLGYAGFNKLCELMIKQLPEFKQKFDIKQKLAEGVFVLASTDLPQERAVQWVKELKKWLLTNFFTIDDQEYYFEVVAVVLSNFPAQDNELNLLRKAENILLERDHSKKTIVIDAESTKEQKFEKIKSQLEYSIKTRDFHWHYNRILSTKDETKKIYQLEIALHSKSGEEITSDDYLDVAEKSGMLRLLSNFTFEHAIRIIRDGEQKKVETVALLEQNLLDYASQEQRDKLIKTIKDLNLPKDSIVFQFSLTDAKKHLDILREVGRQLKSANVLICLSEFVPNEKAWKIARTLRTNWIRLKPFDEHHALLNSNETDNLAQIISKSNILCYEVMISNVNNFDLAIKLADLNLDYIQGRFIKSKDSDILLKQVVNG